MRRFSNIIQTVDLIVNQVKALVNKQEIIYKIIKKLKERTYIKNIYNLFDSEVETPNVSAVNQRFKNVKPSLEFYTGENSSQSVVGGFKSKSKKNKKIKSKYTNKKKNLLKKFKRNKNSKKRNNKKKYKKLSKKKYKLLKSV